MPRSSDRLPRHPLSWRSRPFRFTFGLLTVCLLVRLLWGHHVRRTLQTQLAEIRARGEPATVADLTFDPVPDPENAFTLQAKAAGITSSSGIDSPSSSNDEYREYPPFPSYWMKRAADSEKAHPQAFVLARQARGLSRAQLRTGSFPRPAARNVYLPVLNASRNLANTLGDAALYAHVGGDDAEAVERVRDVLHLGRSLHADPFMISQMSASASTRSRATARRSSPPGCAPTPPKRAEPSAGSSPTCSTSRPTGRASRPASAPSAS